MEGGGAVNCIIQNWINCVQCSELQLSLLTIILRQINSYNCIVAFDALCYLTADVVLWRWRDRILERIEFRFGNLFFNLYYFIATCTHPFCFKSNWRATGALRGEARAKLKPFLHDSSSSISDKTTNSDDFENFENAQPTKLITSSETRTQT